MVTVQLGEEYVNKLRIIQGVFRERFNELRGAFGDYLSNFDLGKLSDVVKLVIDVVFNELNRVVVFRGNNEFDDFIDPVEKANVFIVAKHGTSPIITVESKGFVLKPNVNVENFIIYALDEDLFEKLKKILHEQEKRLMKRDIDEYEIEDLTAQSIESCTIHVEGRYVIVMCKCGNETHKIDMLNNQGKQFIIDEKCTKCGRKIKAIVKIGKVKKR